MSAQSFTEKADIQEEPLKEAGDPLDQAAIASGDEALPADEDSEDLSSMEKVITHGRHMGF